MSEIKTIELTKENLTALHSEFEIIKPGVIKAIKTEKIPEDDTNSLVMVNGLTFQNAIIEYDFMSKLTPDAPSHARGFIGIGFRINENASEFEGFYVRPTNGKGCEDAFRKSHGCQYFAYPGYIWNYFREFGINDYEAPVSTIELGTWSHVRAEIIDDTAKFYVDGNLVLSLDGNFVHKPSKGKFGFNTHIGTEAYFENLTIEVLD